MKNITKILVLLRKITLEDATRLVNSKKTSQFGTTLLRPKKSQIHIHSVSLVYEPIMALSGLYSADYYRKAVHKIKVDDNVKEVLVGPDTRETECMWIWLFFGLRRVVPNCEVFFELTNRVASSKVILRKSTKIFVIFFMPNVRCSSY